jgi:hypothetical protein
MLLYHVVLDNERAVTVVRPHGRVSFQTPESLDRDLASCGGESMPLYRIWNNSD